MGLIPGRIPKTSKMQGPFSDPKPTPSLSYINEYIYIYIFPLPAVVSYADAHQAREFCETVKLSKRRRETLCCKTEAAVGKPLGSRA